MRISGLPGGLECALREYLEAVARVLRADVASGAEVELELSVRRGRGRVGAAFYSYTPLTDAFIHERESVLERLPERAPAIGALANFDGLDRYLSDWGGGRDRRDGDLLGRAPLDTRAGVGTRAREALRGLTNEIFAEQTDFELRPQRLASALGRLERAEPRRAREAVTLVATLRGLTIASAEVQLTTGLTLARPTALGWAPQAAIAGEDGALDAGEAGAPDAGDGQHLLVALVCDQNQIAGAAPGNGQGSDSSGDPMLDAIAHGRAVLVDLLRALRLFGDGRITLGPLAWARAGDEGRWSAVALGHGGRPRGMLVVAPEQEDELRAFCNLVSRRAPDGDQLAWALRRFELGCERASPFEGLSDHLLALRVLLEPEGPSSGLLAGRIAALCATPEKRAKLTARMTKAQHLERVVVAGGRTTESASSQTLVLEVAEHLRALLRDVICGHLSPDLARLADELLAQAAELDAPAADQQGKPHTSRAAARPDPAVRDDCATPDERQKAPSDPPQGRRRLRRRRTADDAPAGEQPADAATGEQLLIDV